MSTDLTPEQLGMLNGRRAALHAAIADLLDKGVLIQDGQQLRAERMPRGLYITALQEDIRRAIHNGQLPAEDDAVKKQLGTLQAQMAQSGYLNPTGKGSRLRAIAVVVLFGLIVAVWVTVALPLGDHSGFASLAPWLVIAIAFGLLLSTMRKGSSAQNSMLTARGRETLDSYHDRFPRLENIPARGHLGHDVGLHGTRGLLLAFPAAAAIGVPLIDIDRGQLWAASSGAATCGGSVSSPDWCGSHSGHDSSCGAGCSGSSCGSHSSSCSSSSCGSSCGGCSS